MIDGIDLSFRRGAVFMPCSECGAETNIETMFIGNSCEKCWNERNDK